MYERPALDRYQDLVTASYGSPVNPNQTVDGVIELRNPLDDKVLASVPAGLGDPDIKHVVWKDGVDHDDTKSPSGRNAWNQHTNTTTTEHKPTPESAESTPEADDEELVPDEDGDLEDAVVEAANPSESTSSEETDSEAPETTGGKTK